MRKNFAILLGTVVLFSCNQAENASEQEIAGIKSEVNVLLDEWHKAAAEANFDNYFQFLDSNAIFIGTDATENWTKEQFAAFCKPYFDEGKAWEFEALERNIYMNEAPDFLWFDELLDTWMGTCRGSGVLEKTANGWKIQHYVLSIEIPNDVVHDVVEVKSASDSVFLSRFK